MKRRNFIKGAPLVAGAALLPVGVSYATGQSYYQKYWEAQAKIDALEEELYTIKNWDREGITQFDEFASHTEALKMNEKYGVK